MDQLDDEHLQQYRCLQVLLEIKLDDSRDYDDYSDSLTQMYGEENVKTGVKLIDGSEIFHGRHSPGLSLEGFDNHHKLLKGYEKLHKFKQANWI